MRYLAIGMIAFGLLAAAGCVPNRVFLQPTYVRSGDIEFVYMIEQEQQKDSRIKKCDIQPDNSVVCTTQYDLK